MLNILINAGQAIEGSGNIAIRSYDLSESGEVGVDVSDDGCGIQDADLKRIFEPFFTTKPVGEGTGLGLSISFGIIQDMGGSLAVESEVGVGSCFRIRLPNAHRAAAS